MKYRNLPGPSSGIGKIFIRDTEPTVTHLAEPGDCWYDGSQFHMCTAEDPVTHVLTWSSAILVPVGGIIGWSGMDSMIPDGFAVCDGANNSPGPDLSDLFQL